MRVRRTIDLKTNAARTIIKSRIADLEIYNPGTDFDYRISISIESPWDGNPEWLVARAESGKDRIKDRMSYRHMAYQIDLTQVSHSDGAIQQHELEVEISPNYLERELDNLRSNRPSRYEDVVRGLIDEVRLLCRKATLGRR